MLFFSWLDIFCDFFIPLECWSTSSNVKIKFIDAVVFLSTNSPNSFHLIFFPRTKVPGAFPRKRNILLSILCRKFSNWKTCFSILTCLILKNTDHTQIWSEYFWKIVNSGRNHLFFKNVHWGNIRRVRINFTSRFVGWSSENLIFKLFEELLLLAKTWRGEVGISLICDEPPFITGIPIG